MKRNYNKPASEKLEFDFSENVAASRDFGKNPAQCQGHNPGHGCGLPGIHIGSNSPGNCTIDVPRKQPFQCMR